MGLEPQLQTRLYEQYWRPMEVDFGQEAYALTSIAFMRHYLTVKTGEIPTSTRSTKRSSSTRDRPVQRPVSRPWSQTSAPLPATTAQWH